MSVEGPQKKVRQFRTKRADDEVQDAGPSTSGADVQETEELQRDKLEQMRLLQKLRKRVGGTTADALALGDAEEQQEPETAHVDPEAHAALMGGFSKAQTIVTTDEDPNMQAFVEAELARRMGKQVDEGASENPAAKRKRLEAEMYQIPDELKSSLNGDVVVPGMTAIITEVPLSAAVRLRNIEAVENMKKQMLSGHDDTDGPAQGPKVNPRKQFVESFGRQKKVDLSREQLEEQHKRMKYVSERRPAVPLGKTEKKRK